MNNFTTLKSLDLYFLSQVPGNFFDYNHILITTKKDATAQNMKFSIMDFFSECDQILSFVRIWSHLLKKSWTEMSFFVQWAVLSTFTHWSK